MLGHAGRGSGQYSKYYRINEKTNVPDNCALPRSGLPHHTIACILGVEKRQPKQRNFVTTIAGRLPHLTADARFVSLLGAAT